MIRGSILECDSCGERAKRTRGGAPPADWRARRYDTATGVVVRHVCALCRGVIVGGEPVEGAR